MTEPKKQEPKQEEQYEEQFKKKKMEIYRDLYGDNYLVDTVFLYNMAELEALALTEGKRQERERIVRLIEMKLDLLSAPKQETDEKEVITNADSKKR